MNKRFTYGTLAVAAVALVGCPTMTPRTKPTVKMCFFDVCSGYQP